MINVLVVDDNEQDRHMLQVLLESHGYNVTTAANGTEALEMASRSPPDLIISDLLMPGMDGFALCRQWKQDAFLKDIPFVVYTATYTDARDQEFALGLGGDRFIIKPQEPDIFVQGLVEVLEEPKARRLRAQHPPVLDSVYLQQYSETLTRKLEQKLAQLEAANQALAKEVAEHRRAEEQVKSFNQQLRALAAHIESVREEERSRMAVEIHDELGQHLTGLKISLFLLAQEFAKPRISIAAQEVVDKITPMLKSIDTAIQGMRNISTQLRPAILDDLGLIPAIEWQAREFQARTGIRSRVSLLSQAVQLGPEATTALFRILQAALTNVALHSKARRVDIRVTRRKNLLWLRVSDNGQGIVQEQIAHPQSLGLLGMKERAVLLGGEFSVTGIPGKGTTVLIKVPLAQ